MRLPEDAGRFRGFGYVEFETRQALIDALALSDEVSIHFVVVCIVWTEIKSTQKLDQSLPSCRILNFKKKRML